MGDRGNIAVQFDGDKNKRIWFYTHWSGSEMDTTIATALARGKGRWGDDAYLARIIFCELVKPDPDGETGFGIDIVPGDNEYPFRVVDLKSRTVFQEPDDRKGFNIAAGKKSDCEPVSWDDFIAEHANPQPETA